jgi:hypothetical protein
MQGSRADDVGRHGKCPCVVRTNHFEDTEGLMGPGRFQRLYEFAQSYFNSINGRSDAPTRDGNLLVAALWDPIQQVIWASTIPRGDAFVDFMAARSTTRTPVWGVRASDFEPTKSYHAEDGAYFAMEYFTQRYSALVSSTVPNVLVNTVYGPGSKVVVWGFFNSDNDAMKATGRRISLCNGRETKKPRFPSCLQLAADLGVTPDPNVSDEYPAELDDDDLLAICDDTVLAAQDPPPPGAPNPLPAPEQKRAWRPRRDWMGIREKYARQIASVASEEPISSTASTDIAASDLPSSAIATSSLVLGQDNSAVSSAEQISACTGQPSTIIITASYDPLPLTISFPPDTDTEILASTPSSVPSLTPSAVIASSTMVASSIIPATPGSSVMSTFQTAISTASPSFSCSYQGADPDEGVTSAYCVCSQGPSTATAPLPRNAAGDAIPSGTNSCPYTAWPGTAAITPTTTLGPASTNIMACQVCSPVVVNEDACTSIPNCTPQFPVATVSIGSAPVNVGTLTGAALSASVSSALDAICPSVTQTTAITQCSGSATIADIAYASGDDLAIDGELQIIADLSGYNDTNLRLALINSLAASAQQAATGSNCYVPEGSAGLGNAAISPTDSFCNSAWFYEADFYNPWWREAVAPGPTDFIHVTIEFHTAPVDFLTFLCDFADLAIDALAAIEPEFAIEDLELEDGINFICQDAEGEETAGSSADGSA